MNFNVSIPQVEDLCSPARADFVPLLLSPPILGDSCCTLSHFVLCSLLVGDEVQQRGGNCSFPPL
ncbi:hypothetical protein ACRRTK_002392 [Alexandromys fortis]